MDNEAYAWLRAAKRDYNTYNKEVQLPILVFAKKTPKEPHNSVYHLSQCVEKLIKSIAITSGYRTAEEVKKYSHDSLSLYTDLIISVLDNPICESFFSSVEGKIFKESDAKLYSYSESIQRLAELKRKAKLGSINKEMNEWAWEFATLPEDIINKIVNQQKKSLRLAKAGAFIIHLIPTKFFKHIKLNSGSVYTGILGSSKKRGFLLSEDIQRFLSQDKIKAFISRVDEEKKLAMISKIGDILVIACLCISLLCLAALTYTHSVATRYPDNEYGTDATKHRLNSESYSEKLGFTRALTNVGSLTHMVLKEFERRINSFTDIKVIFNNVSKELDTPNTGG